MTTFALGVLATPRDVLADGPDDQTGRAAGREADPAAKPARRGGAAGGRQGVRDGAGGGDALIQATSTFDEPALIAMFGPDNKDLVSTGDAVRDKSYALAFAALAKEGHAVVVSPSNAEPGHAAGGPGTVAAARAAREGCGQVVFRRQGRTRRDPLPPRRRQ